MNLGRLTLNKMNLAVREIELVDIPRVVDYWMNASDEFLIGMGVDLSKMPSRDALTQMLKSQIALPYNQKQSYALIWLVNNQAVGHSNVNNIKYGEIATMHLHLWTSDLRQKGIGTQLVKLGIPFFFKNLKLDILICEPYAQNSAPNKTLLKVGFEFIKTYETIPGSLNFLQEVNQYKLTKKSFENF